MNRVVMIAAAAAALALALPAGAGEPLSVRLTVEERLGVGRTAEPVTSGVPLPRGAVKDVSELVLCDAAGTPVPAQFGVANRWWDDKSIKWLHVDFSASVPANGSAVYTLKKNGAGEIPGPPAPVSVKLTDAGAEVDTGVLRFTVKQKGFNLFDSVSLNGRQIVTADHGGGIALRTADGDFSPAAFGETSVAVEEQGPMKAVLLVVGRNVAADGSGYAMDYRLRICAYAGSPLVRVVYTIENRRGQWADHIDVADWKLVLPVSGGDVRYCLGLGEESKSGALAKPEDSVRLDVLATDLYRLSGAQSGEGDPQKERPPWIGFLDVSGASGGVTVGFRNFWQMWSKYLTADGAGNLTVGFWTDAVRDKGETTFVDAQGRAQFYAGVARTQEFFLNFHDAAGAGRLEGAAAAREPLFARCDPAWYCWGTRAFGDLSEADPEVYLPEWKDRIVAFNAWCEEAVRKPWKRWQTEKAGKVDSFGLLNYGDGIEEIRGTKPEQVHWEGGYYDYPHSIVLEFARTGDLFFLWAASDMARHNADVHHVHHDEKPGRSRYCPSYAHILESEGKPYASNTFNHWKNLSSFERWYLLADHQARESAMEIEQWAMRLGNDGIDWKQPRSMCHGILGFWGAYDLTGEQQYLDAMTKFAQAVAKGVTDGKQMGSGAWQRGMAVQGLCWYVEVTGDESVVPAIEEALRRDFSAGPSEMAYGMAFMWKRTGEKKYFDAAEKRIHGGEARRWMQRFGNEGRSKMYVPAIVRKDAPRKPPEPAPADDAGDEVPAPQEAEE